MIVYFTESLLHGVPTEAKWLNDLSFLLMQFSNVIYCVSVTMNIEFVFAHSQNSQSFESLETLQLKSNKITVC